MKYPKQLYIYTSGITSFILKKEPKKEIKKGKKKYTLIDLGIGDYKEAIKDLVLAGHRVKIIDTLH